MKYLCIPVIVLFILGCSTNNESAVVDRTSDYNLSNTKGLSDCNVFKLYPDTIYSKELYVVRCPNSITSTTHESNRKQPDITTVVIDGKKYIRSE